jgi:hypothetical protein
MLQAQVDADEWVAFCSATLVAPDVVLTAAHCTDFFTAAVGADGFGPDDLRVSFDVAHDESSTYYVADHIVVHPDWLTAGPCLGNSKHLCLASPAEDIALVFLQETVSGVTPSPIAGRGYLDELDVTSETFTGSATALTTSSSARSSTACAAIATSPPSTRTTPSPIGSSR